MMKRYFGNAFSLSMIEAGCRINTKPASIELVQNFFKKTNIQSVVGHQTTADILTGILGSNIPVNRVSIKLNPGDQLIVAQYNGPRLPEGATVLPEGATMEFILVDIEGDLVPYENKFDDGSIYGAIMREAKLIASRFQNGEAIPMQDSHGNFMVEINGRGLHATMWDD